MLSENGVTATASAIVAGLDHATATRLLDHIHTGAIAGPLSLLGDLGAALLAIAAVKAGAAQWTPLAIAAGAIGAGVGFATGNLRDRGFQLGAGQMGENVTTRGIDLLGLPRAAGLHLGKNAVVEVTGLRNPCQ